jgi:hypothetical protein
MPKGVISLEGPGSRGVGPRTRERYNKYTLTIPVGALTENHGFRIRPGQKR